MEAKGKFEPRVDTTALVPLVAVTGSALYWWLVIVPSERASLSSSKRQGPLREYLEELGPSEDDGGKGGDRSLERWFYSQYLNSSWFKRRMTPLNDSKEVKEVKEESWIDLLKPTVSSPTPNFWSLDNPILTSLVFIMAAGVLQYVSQLIRGV